MIREDKTVLAQNYALGISSVGFILYPLFNRFCKDRLKTVYSILTGAGAVLCIALICSGTAYTGIFTAGLVLFLLLGLLGSAVFYGSMCRMKTDRYLARTVGISYALGVLFQFANNNLIRSENAEAVILSVCLMLLVLLLIKNDRFFCEQENSRADTGADDEKNSREEATKGTMVGVLLILLVVLMTCMFSTPDNAVTLVHSSGEMDIGQWPRILLALSGLSAGFFAVFFTCGFMEISRHMKTPQLWAGMGRAVNNITAAVIANPVLALLSSDRNLAVIILVLVLFAAVSVAAIVYTVQKKNFMEQLVADAAETVSEQVKLKRFSEVFSFTDREAEVLACLVNTEDSIQEIADSLYISRRTLERNISAIYEKTGVKSRIGLLNLYNK